MNENMKILIADDSSDKIAVIMKTLKELPEYSMLEVDYTLDLISAKEHLMRTFYDLLILDLNMPVEIGDASNMTAGVEFIDEIMSIQQVKKPLDILVLSAFDSSLQSFKEQVEKSGFVALHFDALSTDWHAVLHSKVNHLLDCHLQRKYMPRLPECDVLIVTAVPIETQAILSLEYEWRELPVEGDSTKYRHANVNSNGQSVSIIHVQLPKMGMTSASTMITKAIMYFDPQYIIMPGIAAGVGKDVNIGDILVATEIWDYSSGKYEEIIEAGEKRVRLSPDPRFISIPKTVSDRLEFYDYTAVLKAIRNSYPSTAPSHELKIHFGQMACGPAVVASEEIVNQQVKAHARKALGLDMESYGVYYAAQTTTISGTKAIVAKSVCDFADKNKDDKNQEYAAYTSAQFAKYLIEIILLKSLIDEKE